MNYNTKGAVESCIDAKCSGKEDSCSGKTLIEWYCQNNEAKNEEHECEFECDNGMCLKVAKEYKLVGSGGGGGGGGSSGGGISSPTPAATTGQIYNLRELSSEQTIEIIKIENVQFSISGIEHLLSLHDNSETQATVNIDSAGAISLNVGNEKNIDLNNDGVYDLYIKLNSINIITNKIRLTLSLDY